MAEQNPFIWQELVTTDQEKSGAFYSKLFGWSIKQVDAGDYGTYTIFKKDGQDVAGMMNPTSETPGEGSYWHAYIAVEDIDDSVKQTTQLGGKVLVPPHHIPDEGQVCVIQDPAGAILHLMQPEK
jgi:predicted enzyme related to lactoylglutathione lyase